MAGIIFFDARRSTPRWWLEDNPLNCGIRCKWPANGPVANGIDSKDPTAAQRVDSAVLAKLGIIFTSMSFLVWWARQYGPVQYQVRLVAWPLFWHVLTTSER